MTPHLFSLTVNAKKMAISSWLVSQDSYYDYGLSTEEGDFRGEHLVSYPFYLV